MLIMSVVIPIVEHSPFAPDPVQGYVDLQWLRQGLTSFSPFGGQIMPLELMIQPWHQHRDWTWEVQFYLIALTFLFSLALLFLVIRVFDRALGRVKERPGPSQRPSERIKRRAEALGSRR